MLLPWLVLACTGAPEAPEQHSSTQQDTPAPDSPEGTDSPAEPAVLDCSSFSEAQVAGVVQREDLSEISALVFSLQHPGVLWAHNDSGDGPRLFALGIDGAHRAVVSAPTAQAVDWEDMSLAPNNQLIIGDIGDNRRLREGVQLYRVPEPAELVDGAELSAERFDLTYPGEAQDAETLMVDPRDGQVLLLTKSFTGQALLMAAPNPLASGELRQVGELQFGGDALPGGTTPTGGDVSSDGRWVVIRSYTHAFFWPIASEQSVAEAMSGPACALPVASEAQGESVAASPQGYMTVSEGPQAELHFFPLVEPGL